MRAFAKALWCRAVHHDNIPIGAGAGSWTAYRCRQCGRNFVIPEWWGR
jgi:hypothetical protein